MEGNGVVLDTSDKVDEHWNAVLCSLVTYKTEVCQHRLRVLLTLDGGMALLAQTLGTSYP